MRLRFYRKRGFLYPSLLHTGEILQNIRKIRIEINVKIEKMTKIFEKITKIFENIIKFSKNDPFLKKKQNFFVKIEISVKFEIFRGDVVMKMIFLKLLSC